MTLWLLNPDLCPLQLFEITSFSGVDEPLRSHTTKQCPWSESLPNRLQNQCDRFFKDYTINQHVWQVKMSYFTNEYDIYIRFLNLYKFWLMVHRLGKYQKNGEDKFPILGRYNLILRYVAQRQWHSTSSTQQVTWRHLNEHLFSGWIHMLIVQHIQVVVQSQCDKHETRSHNSTSWTSDLSSNLAIMNVWCW